MNHTKEELMSALEWIRTIRYSLGTTQNVRDKCATIIDTLDDALNELNKMGEWLDKQEPKPSTWNDFNPLRYTGHQPDEEIADEIAELESWQRARDEG